MTKNFLFQECSEAVLDILYPPLCRVCTEKIPRHDGRNVCPSCWSRIESLPEPTCMTCGAPAERVMKPGQRCELCPPEPVYFDRAVAFGRYDGVLRDIIHWYKYRYKKELSKSLAELLLRAFQEKYSAEPVDAVVPVPLHWWRKRWREFNQARLVAEYIAGEKQVSVLEQLVVRRRSTRPQSSCRSISQKQQNIAGAFSVPRPGQIRDKSLLLVDDIITTGSTVNECARVLKEAGAAKVHVLALARAVKRHR
jgi:ComF family protein